MEKNCMEYVKMEEALLRAAKPIHCKGTLNTRDLGGYVGRDGKKTSKGKLFRSDSLERLTDSGLECLMDYGVTCCIDFRMPEICHRFPSRLAVVESVDYCNFPIDDHIGGGLTDEGCWDMGDIYIEFLKQSGQSFVGALRKVLEHEHETILFHCTAGKDRTGMMAMFLLSLAGVKKEDILMDYMVTEYYMDSRFREMREDIRQYGKSVPEGCFSSRPELMDKAMDYLEEHYGSVEQYLIWEGMTTEEIQRLKRILIS